MYGEASTAAQGCWHFRMQYSHLVAIWVSDAYGCPQPLQNVRSLWQLGWRAPDLQTSVCHRSCKAAMEKSKRALSIFQESCMMQAWTGP
jgi:hypothetical protein